LTKRDARTQRTWRFAAAAPCPPATVDKPEGTRLLSPISANTPGWLNHPMSRVMVSAPNPPEPFARAARSDMLLEQERPASAGVDGILIVGHGIARRCG
jgi:hypothetical protein